MAEEKETLGSESEFSAPTESIENCVSIIESIYAVKADSVVTAEEIYAITGKPRGTMSPKISAAIQYKLLMNNTGGKGYRITDFGISIIRPEYTETTYIKSKLLEAFNTPVLYKKLIERYNSKNLPNREGLTNTLVTDYGLNKNSTGPKASYTFLENCSYLGIDEGNRLRFFMPLVTTPENNGAGKKPEVNGNSFTPPPPPDNNTFRLPIDLGEKTAFLEYPKDITIDEIGELKIMVDAAISALELRKKRNKNPVE